MGVSVCGIDHINVCMCGVMCVCYAQHTTLSANHQKILGYNCFYTIFQNQNILRKLLELSFT